ncbi:MAG: leucine-rich repeat protein [Clostridia bacterium]|nr:leucine-rich repeat protein [Clostridia bacterium]
MKAVRKFISLLICALLVVALCACGDTDYDGSGLEESVFISEEKNEAFRYEVYEDYTIITEYFGEDFRVNIPSRLGGKPVKGIGDNAIGISVLAIDIVDIPKSVVYISPSAFSGCTTTTIYTVAEGNPVYKSEDGAIYSKDGKSLLHYPSGKLEETITVSSGVETIGGYAFANNEDVVKISLPSSVTSIKEHAFDGCDKLNKLNFPEGITEIGDYACYECPALAEINLPSTLKTIGAHAFDYCLSVKKVTVPDSVVQIGDAAFMRCKSLSDITLSSSLERYGYQVFTGCNMLKEIKLAPGNTNFRVADGILYSFKGDELVDYPYGKGEDKIKINESVKSIRNYAFYKDTTQSDVELADYIVEVDFSKVEKIGAYAFANRDAIGAVSLPSTLKEISATAFNECKKIVAYRIKDCANYISVDDVLYTADKKTLVAYPCGSSQIAYSIPEGTENVASYAFSNAENLTSVSFPATLKTIGDYSFYKSVMLESVELGKSIESIGKYCFANCITLETVTIPDNTITSIPDGAFTCCDGMFDFIVPNGVTEIGAEAFRETAYLVYIEMPETVKVIKDYAFYDMDNLHDITIPSSVTEFGKEIVSIYDESNPDKVVLYVSADSPAEDYAKTNNIPYEIL